MTDVSRLLAFNMHTGLKYVGTLVESHLSPIDILMLCRKSVYGVPVDIMKSVGFKMSFPTRILVSLDDLAGSEPNGGRALLSVKSTSESSSSTRGIIPSLTPSSINLTPSSINRWAIYSSP